MVDALEWQVRARGLWLQITGGEPLIDKDVPAAYAYANEPGMMVAPRRKTGPPAYPRGMPCRLAGACRARRGNPNTLRATAEDVAVSGVVLNALGLTPAIMTVVVIDDVIFDDLFRDLVTVNAEGQVITSLDSNQSAGDLPLTKENVHRLLDNELLKSQQRGLLSVGLATPGELDAQLSTSNTLRTSSL